MTERSREILGRDDFQRGVDRRGQRQEALGNRPTGSGKLMLCQKCGQREATVYVTTIIGDKMQKEDLCATCFEVAKKPEAEVAVRVEHERCDFCGDMAEFDFEDPIAISVYLHHTKNMCYKCLQEYSRFVSVGIERIPTQNPESEQLKAFQQLYQDANAYMEKWVSLGPH